MYCTREPEQTLKVQCAALIAQFKTRRIQRDLAALSLVMTALLPHLIINMKSLSMSMYLGKFVILEWRQIELQNFVQSRLSSCASSFRPRLIRRTL